MDYLRFALVGLNGVLFLGIFLLSLRYRRRESSPRMIRLWTIVALVSGALVVGAIQRVLVQASALEWLPRSNLESASTDWQLVQSIVVSILAVLAFTRVRDLAHTFAASERVAGSILDRVSHIDLDAMDISPRESEVLSLIGNGLLTDVELSKALHISTSTVQSHVKSLLRKTGLSSRKDLIGVAHIGQNRP